MRLKTLKSTNAFVFVIIVLLAGVGSAPWLRLPATKTSFWDGSLFRRIESHYEDTFPHRDIINGFWAALKYQVFNEGKPGVVPGADGWLFSREEYHLDPDHEQWFIDNLEQISTIRTMLVRRNVQLVLVLVPEKADIYRKYASQQSAHTAREFYQQSLRELRARGVAVVDIRTPFIEYRYGDRPLFFRTDTHWTVAGARRAARQVAASGLVERGTSLFGAEEQGSDTFAGDLTRFIPVGRWFAGFGPPLESYRVVELYPLTDQTGLFDELTLDTALVGTSYSADSRWQFLGWLQFLLQKEIVNYAESGQGPFCPMHTFINNLETRQINYSTVIWEIPVRYLVQKATQCSPQEENA